MPRYRRNDATLVSLSLSLSLSVLERFPSFAHRCHGKKEKKKKIALKNVSWNIDSTSIARYKYSNALSLSRETRCLYSSVNINIARRLWIIEKYEQTRARGRIVSKRARTFIRVPRLYEDRRANEWTLTLLPVSLQSHDRFQYTRYI